MNVQLMNRLSRKDSVNIPRRIVDNFYVHNCSWEDFRAKNIWNLFLVNKGKLSNLINVELEFNLHHTFRIGSPEFG